jgi:hypothetical protein
MTVLHAGARAADLAVLRVAVFVTWLAVVARTPLDLYPDIPAELFEPRGVMRLLPTEALLAAPTALLTLKVLAVAGCALCVLGIRPFPAVAVPTVSLLVVFDGATKSLGLYANHDLAALLFVAMLVSFFPAGDAISVMGRRRDAPPSSDLYGAALQLSVLVLALTYALAGFRRLITGGVEVFATDSIVLWLVARSSEWAAYGFDEGLRVLDHEWLRPAMVLGMLVATVAEALSPLVLCSRRFRLVWVPVIVGFHLFTLLTMRIFFWPNLVLIAVLVAGLGPWIARRLDPGPRSSEPDPGRGDRPADAVHQQEAQPAGDGHGHRQPSR